MRVRGFFSGEKKYIKKQVYISFMFFVLGIIIGAVYCVLLKAESDVSLSNYFEKYFSTLQNGSDKSLILKNALLSYIRIFSFIFISAFARPGIVLTLGTVAAKGFTSGFTTASAVKYYGVRGLLIPASSFLSLLLYLPALLVLAAGSINCSQTCCRGEKRDLRLFLTLAICCLTIFCTAAFSDAFITTTFMKLYSAFITN